MKDEIRHVKSFISLIDAKNIYNYAKTVSPEFFKQAYEGANFTIYPFSSNTTDSKKINILLTELEQNVYEYVKSKYPGPFKDFDPLQCHISKFEKGHGMHEHFDTSKPNDITTLIYLNDDYEGGEIYFPEHGISIKPEAGDLVCFPDNENYVHGVMPVISGTRYASPMWFTRIT
jgi:hypothetical protein